MCDAYDWLPPLCRLSDFAGDWGAYEAELYHQFQNDWVVLRPYLQGRPVGHATEPMHEGKPEAFWHLTSETDPETGERLPNLRRCERLRWAKALITEVANRDDVVTWRERRRDGLRQLFALDDFSYLVVVALRSRGRMYLATAYPVDMEWRRTKLHKQFNRASQKGGG